MWAVVYIVAFIGWFLNLFHCLSYLGGGNVDDSTAEIALRLIGVVTFLPGAIMGYF